MREFKFKVLNGAEQVIVHSIYQDKGDNQIWWALDENDEWFMCSEPRQYTGLKDINGHDIYEGDIYEYELSISLYDNDMNLTEKHKNIKSREVIKFKNGAFMVGDYTLQDALENDDGPVIVGNIYENPELLGDTK